MLETIKTLHIQYPGMNSHTASNHPSGPIRLSKGRVFQKLATSVQPAFPPTAYAVHGVRLDAQVGCDTLHCLLYDSVSVRSQSSAWCYVIYMRSRAVLFVSGWLCSFLYGIVLQGVDLLGNFSEF